MLVNNRSSVTCSYIQSNIANMASFIVLQKNIIDNSLFSLIFSPLFFGYILLYIYALFPVIRPPYELISFLTVNMVYSVYETLICFFPCLLCYYTKCQLFPCFQPLIFIPKRVWKTYLGYFFLCTCSFFRYFIYHSNSLIFFSLKRFIRYMKSDHPCHQFLAETF